MTQAQEVFPIKHLFTNGGHVENWDEAEMFFPRDLFIPPQNVSPPTIAFHIRLVLLGLLESRNVQVRRV